MNSRRSTTFAAVTVAVAALGLVATGTASANSADDTFLAAIYAEGISYPTDREAIADAFLVCDYLAAGRNGTDISTEIIANSDLSPRQAASIVVEASAAYCARYFDQVVG
jgi:Protein of unknown function (DUF732)